MNLAIKKKLIEVSLPLDAINKESARAKRKSPAGYPTTIHKWWAQRPIAACRAILFASLVNDPSSEPERFATEEAQEIERKRLFDLIEELVKWENSSDERILQRARDEIIRSTGGILPVVYDPFCGGGSIPLEAQRLGLKTRASDLNPVPVLINKALVELPHKFLGRNPVHPGIKERNGYAILEGLAEDVRFYGGKIYEVTESQIGGFYPKVILPNGAVATGIAWLWARTVISPNPVARGARVPLATTFWLSKKADKKVWVEPVIDHSSMTYSFKICSGTPQIETAVKNGTKIGRGANFRCLLTDTPIASEYIKAEGMAGRMGTRLMAIVVNLNGKRAYFPASDEQESSALSAVPKWEPEEPLADDPRNIWCTPYGFTHLKHLFTKRQLLVLTTLCDSIADIRESIIYDSAGDIEYADGILTYLSCALSRCVDYGSAICTWRSKDNAMRSGLAKQVIPMAWDFAEGSPFGDSSSGFLECVEVVVKCIEKLPAPKWPAIVEQRDATSQIEGKFVYSTDPPYYDNISYADLSDFLYVWHRRSLRHSYPNLFRTIVVPKKAELVATPMRHAGSKADAKRFFEEGLGGAFRAMRQSADEEFPVTVYYAFKQSEEEDESPENILDAKISDGPANTGWETMLTGLIGAGFYIDGTWPIRTEGDNRQVGIGANALASSIVLVCRPRPADATVVSRREFLTSLKRELPQALRHLQRGNIAPVDLAQAAIGPGMAVFSRHLNVMEGDGSFMSVREALTLINQILAEVLAEQEGEFDASTRWALAWFEQFGASEAPYGIAETLSKAKNTSVAGMVEDGIVSSSAGKVRLLRRDELPANWDPRTDKRLTDWETAQHLILALDSSGEAAAATLLAKLPSEKTEACRDLAYQLYALCEKKKWAQDAIAYNGLIIAWPELVKLAQAQPSPADDSDTPEPELGLI